MELEQTFGGASDDLGFAVQQAADGGYVIVGETKSFDVGSGDAYIIKTDNLGNKEWDKAFGGVGREFGSSIQKTADGGYVIAGITYSIGAGNSDVWLFKIDDTGNMKWNQTFGGTGEDWVHTDCLQQTSDGGYVIGGRTNSFGAEGYDVYLVKSDAPITPDHIPPIISDIEATPNPVAANNTVELTAIIDDSTTGNSIIASAEYEINNSGVWIAMNASDGTFDAEIEDVEATIPGFGEPGNYTIRVRGTDSAGNTGDEASVTLVVNPLPAIVDINPDTLNLKSKGRWITCYIELPEGYNVNDIDVDTILLEGVMEAQRSNVQGDVLMVKFDRRELIDYLDGVTGDITLTVTGEMDGNIPFEGSDAIRVIKPGKAPVVPHEFALLQNYPNYFNPETWIPYRLAEDVDVSIKVFDISGRLIRSLNLGHRPAGFYVTKEKAAYWDGRNEAGEYVSSGVYFYRIQAGKFTATRKMIARK